MAKFKFPMKKKGAPAKGSPPAKKGMPFPKKGK